MPKWRCPLAMRRFVLRHQEERLGLIAALEPRDRLVRDDIGHIAAVRDLLAVLDHRRVVIESLPRQDAPVIESDWVADEVPFSDQGCRVTSIFEQFHKRRLRTIEA